MDDVGTWIVGIATAILACATAILAGAVLWQAKLQKKQLRVLEGQLTQMAIQAELTKRQLEAQIQELQLSHRPYVYPRFQSMNIGEPILVIVNIGRGDAKDVHLQIRDSQDQVLESIDRYVLRSGEEHPTRIMMKEKTVFKIMGGYSDFTEGPYRIDKTFEYPPKEIQIF